MFEHYVQGSFDIGRIVFCVGIVNALVGALVLLVALIRGTSAYLFIVAEAMLKVGLANAGFGLSAILLALCADGTRHLLGL